MRSILIALFVFMSGSAKSQMVSCKNIIDSLLRNNSGVISAESKKYIHPCIYEIQNKGFMLAEQACKYDSARIKVEEALVIWKHLHDTLNEANLLKFLGYMNGKLSQFSLGKAQIKEAIRLFNVKKADYGVAVSWFDLSMLYESENKIDSAIYFSEKALHYWKGKNISRVMILHNYLIHLYTLIDKPKEVRKFIVENNANLKSKDIYSLQILDFYYLAYKYFEKIKEVKIARYYLELYNNKIVEVKGNSNVDRYSLYDERNCR